MTVLVRPAHASELSEVGALTVAAYAADGAVQPGDPYAAHLADAVTRAREAEVYVATWPENGSSLAGTVTYCPQGSPWCEVAEADEGEFRMLAVAPEHRRHGVARALVGVCLERSIEHGYAAVVLSSLPVQTKAHALYASLGFRRLPDRDWSPAEGIDLWAFGLRL